MAVITTVCGDIAPEELGFTSMHEHTLFDMSEVQQAVKGTLPPVPPEQCEIKLENMNFLLNEGIMYNDEFYHNTDYDATAFELGLFKELGGDAIVDGSPCFIRTENILDVRRLSEQTGVKIICPTGFCVTMTPSRTFAMTEAQMYDRCMDEITNGIDGTDVFPGYLKTFIHGADPSGDFEPHELNSLRATGRAAAETGMLIQVHHQPGIPDDIYYRAVDMLCELGMKPEKIQMLHQDLYLQEPLEPYVRGTISRSDDYRLAEKLFEMGVTVSFDTWGERMPSVGIVKNDDNDRLRMLVHFLEEGRASQIVLGHDCVMKIFGVLVGGHGYTRVSKFVVGNLRALGFDEAIIEQMTVTNPRRLLAH